LIDRLDREVCEEAEDDLGHSGLSASSIPATLYWTREEERRLATVFTRIIEGEVPACFVWRDPSCVAFLNITPLAPGHTLVVPKEETSHWIYLVPELAAHLMAVSQAIGKALQQSFEPEKIGLAIAGLEIPHAHVHVWPIHGPMSFPIDPDEEDPPEPDWEKLGDAADSIRRALKEFGFHQHVAD
jgi:diadenosine tetraphosphate (Ap4A) HIT family hydrolase